MLFEEFYDIRLGVPESGLPSFAYSRVDEYARVYPREYGTIVPREVDSVQTYDPDVLAYLLADYLIEKCNAYKIVGVAVIMKPDDQFREESLLAFFDKQITMLCIRGGLAVNVQGMPETVYYSLPSSSLSDLDCEIISDLNHGLNMENPQRALNAFKARYPSLIVGYDASAAVEEPEVPEASFMEQGTEMVEGLLQTFGKVPQSVLRNERRTIYTLAGGTEITVSSNAITDRISVTTGYGSKVTYRQSVDRGESIVRDAVRAARNSAGSLVGSRTYTNLITELCDTSGLIVEVSNDGEGHVVRSVHENRPVISLHNTGCLIVAEFTHNDTNVVATLQYSSDVDDFTEHLRSALSKRFRVKSWAS